MFSFFPFPFENPKLLFLFSDLVFNFDSNLIKKLKVLETSKETFQILKDLNTF